MATDTETHVLLPDGRRLGGNLVVPDDARGIVVFAHGSGSSRHSPRNQMVAASLHDRGIATLLVDLLTADEELVDERTRELRFDIELLANRLVASMSWVARHDAAHDLPVGLFGASTGAAAALVAAALRPDEVRAVVSRGGRPDLAGDRLGRVRAPTLLIVGGADPTVIDLNRQAAGQLPVEPRLEIIPNASHLFEEPGALEEVARLAGDWFTRHLQPR